MKRNIKTLFATITSVFMISAVCFADIPVTYESARAGYGDKADAYTIETKVGDTVTKEVLTTYKAKIMTETNVRIEPSAECTVLDTLPKETPVLVWGACENGWFRVFCKNSDGSGNNVFGFIRDYLLFPMDYREKSEEEGSGSEEG